MNSAARIAKLEGLLERIQSNRRPRPGPIALGGAAPSPAAPPAPPAKAPPPEPEAFAEATTEERVAPPPKPTPMEMALESELESRPEVEVEITVDEGPDITIDEEGEIEAAETAPIGTPAPVSPQPIAVSPAKPSAPVARVVAPRPQLAPATFGDLLERALALRPR